MVFVEQLIHQSLSDKKIVFSFSVYISGAQNSEVFWDVMVNFMVS